MGWYFKDGACHELPEGEDLPEGAVEIERAPEEGEVVQPDGTLQMDAKLRSDHRAGAEFIERVRLMKYMEAVVIGSGVPLTEGFLVREAVLRGVTLPQMARMVLDRMQSTIDREMNRVDAKL